MRDSDPHKLFDELDVSTSIFGQVFVGRDACCGLLPAGEVVIRHFNVGERVEVGGEVFEQGTVDRVGGCNFENFEVVEDVWLGNTFDQSRIRSR